MHLTENPFIFRRYLVCLVWVGSDKAIYFSSCSRIPKAVFCFFFHCLSKKKKKIANWVLTVRHIIHFCIILNVTLFIITPVIHSVVERTQIKTIQIDGVCHLVLQQFHIFITVHWVSTRQRVFTSAQVSFGNWWEYDTCIDPPSAVEQGKKKKTKTRRKLFHPWETVWLMCSEEDTGRWCAAVVTKADRLTTSTLCNALVSDYCQQIGSTKA